MFRPFLLAVFLAATNSYAAEPARDIPPQGSEIPLEDVWALDMPGTRDIAELDVELGKPSERTISQLRVLQQLLMASPVEPMEGLVLSGEPKRALAFAMMLLRKREPKLGSRSEVLSDRPANLLFYSFASAYRVELESVTRKDREITVRYRFVPQQGPEAKVGLALIPLGKLPAGKYSVIIEKSPLAANYLQSGFAEATDEYAKQVVCAPFEFHVYDPPNLEEVPVTQTSENEIEIPLEKVWLNGTTRKGHYLRHLEPELFFYRDTPESIAEAAEIPPEEFLAKVKENADKSLAVGLERAARELRYPGKGLGAEVFAVTGSGKEAMREAHHVLVEGAEASKQFSADTEISLFLYTYPLQSGFKIRRIVRLDNEIKVYFNRVKSQTTAVRQTLALIPFGNLPPGDYNVVLERIFPSEQEQTEQNLIGIAKSGTEKELCQFSVSK